MKKFSRSLVCAAALLLAVLMAVCSFGCKPASNETPGEPTAAPAEPTENVEATEEVTEAPTEEPTEAPTEAPVVEGAIEGSWEGEINLAKEMMAEMAADPDSAFGMDVELSDAFVKFIFTFNEDGTYRFEPEMESYKAAMNQIIDELIPVLKEYMMAMFSMFVEEGTEVTEEMVLEMLEIDSWEDLGKEMAAELDENPEDAVVSGQYLYADGKLFLSADLDTTVDEFAAIYGVTVSGAELVFVSNDNETGEDAYFPDELINLPPQILPLVFKKVA